MSEKDLVIELLTITEIKESGEVIFTDRSIEIIKELGEKYEKTPLYKKSRAENPDWEGEANAGLLFVYMCERITEAPTTIHMMMTPKLLLPIIWETPSAYPAWQGIRTPTLLFSAEFTLWQKQPLSSHRIKRY